MRRALIVATSTYRDPKLRLLRAPSKDASALATVLRAPTIGFFDEVITLRNGRLRVLSQRLEDFCRKALLEDLLLVHFSCHGIKDDAGALYFATTDTEIDYLDSTAISAEFLRRQLARSRSRRKLLFLDCCYSGAFSPGLAPRASNESVDIKERFDGRGQVILTASSATEYAFEGEQLTGKGRPSVFTSAVVAGLKTGDADRDGDGNISVDELFDFVSVEVARRTPSQTPRKWSYDATGDITIARSPRQPVRPVPQASSLGWLREQRDPSDGLYVVRAETLAQLPAAVDLRASCPPPFDQGPLGSSVAQPISLALLFSRAKQAARPVAPSRLFIYYNARALKGKQQMDSGATIRDALAGVNQFGAPLEEDWPYDPGKFNVRPPKVVYAAAATYAGIAYKQVGSGLSDLKGCLTEGYPVVFGFPIFESFMTPEVAQTGHAPVPAPKEQLMGGHAALLVGYDDQRSWFWAENSWGSAWGQDGFFTLPYDYLIGGPGDRAALSLWTVRSVW